LLRWPMSVPILRCIHAALPADCILGDFMRNRSTWPARISTIVIAAVVTALAGCASAPSLPAISKTQAYVLVVAENAPADGTLKVQNTAIAGDGRVGLGTGMVAGGLWGLSCGPFAPLCVPLTAAIGGIAGGAAGMAVGTTGELPADKAAQLRERMERLRASHELLGELRAQLLQRARAPVPAATGVPATSVAVNLQALQLLSTRDERMAFVMKVQVSVRPADAAPARATYEKEYVYTAPLSGLSVWLDARSDFLDNSLSSAIQQIAAQIVSELALN
jgi:hypothetical protein